MKISIIIASLILMATIFKIVREREVLCENKGGVYIKGECIKGEKIPLE